MLIQGSQLGAQQLVEFIGCYLGVSGEPGILHNQSAMPPAQHAKFPRVDLDLESQRSYGGDLGLKPVNQRETPSVRDRAGLPSQESS